MPGMPSLEGVDQSVCSYFEVNRASKRKILWINVFGDVLKRRPKIVITEASIALLSTWVLFILRPVLGFRIIFWTHGLENYWKTKPRLSIGDHIRLFWFRSCDALITYGGAGTGELINLGVENNKIFEAPNVCLLYTSDAADVA